MPLLPYDSARDAKLVPLAQNGTLRLTAEQKQHDQVNAEYQKQQRQARKDRQPDVLTVLVGVEAHVREQYEATYGACGAVHAKRVEKYLLMVHFLATKQHKHGYGPLDYVGLRSEILKRHLGKTRDFPYTRVLQDLKDWGVIEIDDSFFCYRPDAKLRATGIPPTEANAFYPKSFRFTESYRNAEFDVVLAKGLKYREIAKRDRDARRAIQNQAERLPVVFVDEMAPHRLWLKECYTHIRFAHEVYELIDRCEQDNGPLKDKTIKIKGRTEVRRNRTFTAEIARCYRAMVTEFNLKQSLGTPEFAYSLTNGRLDTGFTRMFTASRDYLEIDGQRTVLEDPDLAASQVYLLLPRLLATRVGIRYPAEFKAFIELVLAEGFYQHLADWLQIHCPDLEIRDPKQTFFTHVVYSKNHAPTPYRMAFNECFVRVNEALMEIVTQVRMNDEAGEVTRHFLNLAVVLQQDESDLFLNKIAGRLHQELGEDAVLLTLHDGFYCRPEHLETVRRAMVEVLTIATGFSPTVRTSAEKKARKAGRGGAKSGSPLNTHPQFHTPNNANQGRLPPSGMLMASDDEGTGSWVGSPEWANNARSAR